MPQKEKKIEEIERLCEEAGLKPSEVLREAKIPYATVQNWRRKDPQAFVTENKIKETIARMREEKTASA